MITYYSFVLFLQLNETFHIFRKENEFATKFENQFEIDVGEEIVEVSLFLSFSYIVVSNLNH